MPPSGLCQPYKTTGFASIFNIDVLTSETYSHTIGSHATSPTLLTDPALSSLAIAHCLTHPHYSCSL